MGNLMFRSLKAEEIECRVARIGEKGVSLLLYKDARCDMSILDETVGAMNWQRTHLRDNANCIVSIWDGEKEQWISKEDTGTESNTEAQKGLASDSFKRACTNWGIGRELYTAPFIFVKKGMYEERVNPKTNKTEVKDKFSVAEISIVDGKIVGLAILNNSSKQIVYTFGKTSQKASKASAAKDEATIKPQSLDATEDASDAATGRVPTLESVGNEIKSLCGMFGYEISDIVKECHLTKDSVLHDYIKAVDYIKGKAIDEGKY